MDGLEDFRNFQNDVTDLRSFRSRKRRKKKNYRVCFNPLQNLSDDEFKLPIYSFCIGDTGDGMHTFGVDSC
ncbi:unnamed protein product [Euphydryas editha]|uniref:Uncharacterized protein n=1 Tax=Euphydryas editha TaxID=104508 RepID=A0AAU9TTI1_EUPED|nr:unnamed protein product [Euphydryas editha]